MIKRYELFTVPQAKRPDELRQTAVSWMDALEPEEFLLVGLPQVLGKWDECVPLVLPPGYQVQFLTWVDENKAEVRGPHFNLPALNASFLCVVLSEHYDPELGIPDDTTEELRGTLMSFARHIERTKAA